MPEKKISYNIYKFINKLKSTFNFLHIIIYKYRNYRYLKEYVFIHTLERNFVNVT